MKKIDEKYLNYANETDYEINGNIFLQVIDIFYELEILPKKEISLTLMNNLREVNKKFRGKDKTTDVISFPANDLPDEIPFLGDIVIDVNVADNQKIKDLNYELKTLFAHGLLHLLGYDHLAKEEKIKMENIEKQIISNFREV